MAQKVTGYTLSQLLNTSNMQVKVSIGDVVHGWWVTSRMEYLPDAVIHIALPLLLVLRHESWQAEFGYLAFWGLVVWLIGHWSGSSLNCLADYPLDRLDSGHKDRLANAIDRASVRAILFVNALEILIATTVSTWYAYTKEKPLLLFFWASGLLIAYLYSFGPIRLKQRNWWNPAALTYIVYTAPLFFVYHLLSPTWDQYGIAVLIVYSTQMVPMFLVDEVSDHDEDKAMGVNDPCVTYGRVHVTWIANSIYIVACLASLILFLYQTESWSFLRFAAVILAISAYLWVVKEFTVLAKMSQQIGTAVDVLTSAERTQELKRFSKTPAWLVSTGVGVLLLTIVETFF